MYYNGNSEIVEWFDKSGMLHAMRYETYMSKKTNTITPDITMGMIF